MPTNFEKSYVFFIKFLHQKFTNIGKILVPKKQKITFIPPIFFFTFLFLVTYLIVKIKMFIILPFVIVLRQIIIVQ